MLLVTGITGHTGRYFLQELEDNKYEGAIRCVVRETSNTSLLDNSGLDIEQAVGDLEDYEFIANVMAGIDTVLHIYNIHHSPAIVQAAIDNDVKRVILVHTAGIYSKFKIASQEYIDIEKHVLDLATDEHCQTGVTILRPTMIYGDICDHNISKFIRMMDKLRIIPLIDHGDNLVQPVNARDLGKAYFSILMSPDVTTGKAYDLSGDRPIKLVDVLKLISHELGKKTVFFSIPIKWALFGAKTLKVMTLGKMDFVERVLRMGEDRDCSHDIAARDFGYLPMAFKDGIHLEVQEYRNRQ